MSDGSSGAGVPTSTATETIRLTAFTAIAELARNTTLPFVREVWDILRQDLPEEPPRTGKSFLTESRYRTTERLILDAATLAGASPAAVVEIAAGFTPHALSMTDLGIPWIEIDQPANVELKRRTLQRLAPGTTLSQVAGDALEAATWTAVAERLPGGPVAIMSEGFVQYLGPQRRAVVLERVRPLLERPGSFLAYEDSLQYHPELKVDRELMAAIGSSTNIGRNASLAGDESQDDMQRAWESLGCRVTRVPHVTDLETRDLTPAAARVLAALQAWVITLR